MWHGARISIGLDGYRLALTATVMYFVCMNLVPKAIVPAPFYYRAPPEQATYNQAWNANGQQAQQPQAAPTTEDVAPAASETDEA